jgi:16S rRNA (uracil1498-N3)-methyltransferase
MNDVPEELTEPGGKIRLFVEHVLAPGAQVILTADQSHYLLRVMRGRAGDYVLLFNGRDGEWRARITDANRRACVLTCQENTLPQTDVPDLWLVFAPVKRTPTGYLTQKATELGVRALQAVTTHRTIARRVNLERMRANAMEAAEQSGRVSVPAIFEPAELPNLLAEWPNERRLVFCDEGGDALPLIDALDRDPGHESWAILTGPEGGFDEEERAAIRARPFVLPVTLGPRIIRADTAALAALSIWQAKRGDWRKD